MSVPLRLTVAVGTRPEVVKLAPVVRALRGAGHAVRCVATGQHADPRLAGDLFGELDCTPDVVWALDGDEGSRVGLLLSRAFDELSADRPDAVVVLGDTYTAPLVAMAARRFGVGVLHLEAGLRSFNALSMEETNRRLLASLATIHLAPTTMAAGFLRQEGVASERIRVVGNPVLDAIRECRVSRVGLDARSGVLLTAHRASNVDNRDRLAEVVAIVSALGRQHGPVTFPVHPRTRDRLQAQGWWDQVGRLTDVRLTDPLPYVEMLRLIAASRLVVTDSGGLQEEASFLGVPVVVMRSTTPRWEGVESGAAVLAGLDAGRVLEAAGRLDDDGELERVAGLPCPYGDGFTATAVVATLADPAVRELLVPREPELMATPPVPSIPVPA